MKYSGNREANARLRACFIDFLHNKRTFIETISKGQSSKNVFQVTVRLGGCGGYIVRQCLRPSVRAVTTIRRIPQPALRAAPNFVPQAPRRRKPALAVPKGLAFYKQRLMETSKMTTSTILRNSSWFIFLLATLPMALPSHTAGSAGKMATRV